VNVGFSPTAPRSYNGTATVSGDQTSGQNTISVSGTGIAVCQANNTATVTFENRSFSTTLDVIWDGAKINTLSPGFVSSPLTVAAGSHTLRFQVTNTAIVPCT
jgi:hypothetical protein